MGGVVAGARAKGLREILVDEAPKTPLFGVDYA